MYEKDRFPCSWPRALVLSLTLPVSAAEEASYPVLEGGVQEIQKYGNLVLDIDPAEVEKGGYTYGDLLQITVDGIEYEMPLCTNYSDVDTGASGAAGQRRRADRRHQYGGFCHCQRSCHEKPPPRTAPIPGCSLRGNP